MTETMTPTWTLNWRGQTWTDRDLTGEHAAALAEMMGIAPSWDWFDPSDLHPAMGPLQLIALIAAFVVVADDVHGMAARMAVLNAIRDMSLDELLGAIELPEV